MIEVCPLFSGSNGNCTYLEYHDTSLLVDAGVSGKRIIEAMANAGKCAADVSAILITHEHSDHIHAAGILSRKFDIPVFATPGTWQGMINCIGHVKPYNVKIIAPLKPLEIGDFGVFAFDIPHDANQPVGYNFFADGKKITVATDIGAMDDALFLHLAKSDMILLESNHDLDMLRYGSYSYSLKTRILGKYGHLSNDEAAAICARLMSSGTHHYVLGHLSGENNRPELAFDTAARILKKCGAKIGKDVFLSVAERNKEGKLLAI
jgi:phosphoribosyl 1,2-cyclic phosphodiesterase